MKTIYQIALIVLLFQLSQALDNGMGVTPPLGWTSQYVLGCNVNEDAIKNIVQQFVQLGLRDKGYQYILIGDCWQSQRNQQTGQLIEDISKFPSGIKDLALYVHQNNLKIGIYSDAGAYTCSNKPGSLNYETIDAQTFADWGIDYLYYDNCYNQTNDPTPLFTKMRDALNQTGVPIFLAVNDYQVTTSYSSAQQIANSWATNNIHITNWNSLYDVVDSNAINYKYSNLSAWNDAGVLYVNLSAFSHEDEFYFVQNQLALWSIMKSPIIFSCDFTQIPSDILSVIKNEDIISVNQDKSPSSGYKLFWDRVINTETWKLNMTDGSMVIGVFNRDVNPQQFIIDFQKVGFNYRDAYIQDLMQKRSLGIFTLSFTVKVQSQQAQLFQFIPTQQ